MRRLFICAALTVAACAAQPLTPAEVARVRAEDAARVCRALRAPDQAACEAAVVRYTEEQSPYQSPNRAHVEAYIKAADRCGSAGWAFGSPGQMACVENQRREMAEAARRRADAAANTLFLMGAGMNAYATAPRPAPVMPQQTTCRPDFLGGFRCSTF